MGRLRGFLWLTTGMIVAILAGFVAFVTLTRAQAQAIGQDVAEPKVAVVVAASQVAVRSALIAENLELKEIPVDAVPEGAVSNVEDAVGRLTTVDLYPGEVILAQRLVEPNVTTGDARNALIIAEDEVLMAFPAEDLMSRAGVLKAGDQVDLLFSLNVPVPGTAEAGQNEKQATFNLLENVTISAMYAGTAPRGNTADGNAPAAGGAGPSAIMLTVSPQDALVLKYVKDAGGIVDVVLRAPGENQSFPTEPVDVDYLINRYQIPVP